MALLVTTIPHSSNSWRKALRAKGWETHPQIGVSRFRIDLGVVHPDRPGDYLVGVECDGATYHSAATARDRDKVRSEILRGLGWRLVRVWSTEWWVNREGALERLHEAIVQSSRINAPTRLSSNGSGEVEAASAAKAVEAEGEAIVERDTEPGPDSEGELVTDKKSASNPKASERESVRLVARGPNSGTQPPVNRTYCKSDLSNLMSSLQPDMFHDTVL